MKLLVPRERNALQQKEQEQLVKERTQLSGQVDELRQIKEQEAKKLQDFQLREFERYSHAKEEREHKLALLDESIKQKQEEWAKLLEPLDKQWALYVNTEKKKIDSEQARLAELSADLTLKVQENDLQKKELEKRTLTLKQEKANLIAEAEKLEKESQKARMEEKRILDEAFHLNEEAKTARDAVKSLEHEAQIHLREIQLRSEALDTREKELEDREMAVLVKELKQYSPVQGLAINRTPHATQ